MIDMHSHILPGIDDGAADLAEAMAMLRLAAEDGVTIQVLTPHIHIGRYDNTKASLREAFSGLQQQVAEDDLPIELRLSAEVRIGSEILQLVKSEGIPWLGAWEGKRVFLMEFPHSQVPAGSINLVSWLTGQGVLPMIAHPERNRELQASPAKLEPYIKAGCLLQVTAASLTGHFGPDAHRLSVELLREGKVTLLATDCHNLAYRPPVLGEGYRAAAEIIGETAARDLVTTNPQHLLDDL